MPSYWKIFLDGYGGYASYMWNEISHPGIHNYLYALIFVSAFFLALEWIRPWRKNQARFRKDFWLDFFYMFFNFFLFSLLVYNAASNVIVNLFNNLIHLAFHFDLQASNPLHQWPMWGILLTGFVVRDFVQWWTHRLLHKVDFLWEFHKVHHSVEEMGFAAHLRYHWMETVVYRTIEYIPLALLGIGLFDFYLIHIFTLAVGHYNHSNISVSGKVTGGFVGGAIGIIIAFGFFNAGIFDQPTISQQLPIIATGILGGIFILGPVMKIIFNHPEMHIWHHAYELPEERKFGINFGITLALWDYIFGTAYMPHSGRDIKLGFPGLRNFPHKFWGQVSYGFKDIKKYPRA